MILQWEVKASQPRFLQMLVSQVIIAFGQSCLHRTGGDAQIFTFETFFREVDSTPKLSL